MKTKLADQLVLTGPKAEVTGTFGQKGFAIDGWPIEISAKNLAAIYKGELGYEIIISYPKKKGAKFTFEKAGVKAESITIPEMRAGSDLDPALTAPRVTPTGGSPLAYILSGRKLTTGTYTDPYSGKVLEASPGFGDGVDLYLANNSLLLAEGLNAEKAAEAIRLAAKTWDDATNCNLFADLNLVTINPDVIPGKYDGKNTIAFKITSSTCLAVAGSWYRMTKINGYNPIVETDLSFNTAYKWSTDNVAGKYDFQSVVLHELGHTIGMADIYGKPINDGKQIMGYYSGRRTIGNGDAAGIFKLYG